MLRKIENFDIVRKISLPFLKKSNISHSDFLQIYPICYSFLNSYFEAFWTKTQNLTLDMKGNQRIKLHSVFPPKVYRKIVSRYLAFLRDKKLELTWNIEDYFKTPLFCHFHCPTYRYFGRKCQKMSCRFSENYIPRWSSYHFG